MLISTAFLPDTFWRKNHPVHKIMVVSKYRDSCRILYKYRYPVIPVSNRLTEICAKEKIGKVEGGICIIKLHNMRIK